MPRDTREVIESPVYQSTREETVYTFDFAGCGVGTIEGLPTILVLDTTGTDVTATVCGATGTFSGLVVTTPELKNLTAGQVYYVFCMVPHDGGQVRELFVRVIAK